MNIVSTLLEGTETDGGLQVDDGGCVLGLLGLSDGVGDGVEVTLISFAKYRTHSSPFSTWSTFQP